MKRIISLATLMLASTALVACSNQNDAPKEKTADVESSQVVLKKVKKVDIAGSYVDEADGAAIVFNDDGTGRYVFRDSEDGNTDDAFTWKKTPTNGEFKITMNDENVKNPLMAKLKKDKLTLSGKGGWNTETFTRSKKKIDLDKFLAEGSKTNSSSQSSSATGSNSNSKSTVAGDEGLFTIPAEMQGTWYSADHFWDDDDDSVQNLVLDPHTISSDTSETATEATILHKMKKNFDFEKYIQDKTYIAQTQNWGRAILFNYEGHQVVNVRGWLQGAGDGGYYYLTKAAGQTVLVTASGAGMWANAVYWKSGALAQKYANHIFDNINYSSDIDGSNDDE